MDPGRELLDEGEGGEDGEGEGGRRGGDGDGEAETANGDGPAAAAADNEGPDEDEGSEGGDGGDVSEGEGEGDEGSEGEDGEGDDDDDDDDSEGSGGDDSASSSSVASMLTHLSCSLRNAAELMEEEEDDGIPLHLKVHVNVPAQEELRVVWEQGGGGAVGAALNNDNNDNNREGLFGRFVAALRNSVTVRTLRLLRGSFVAAPGDDDDDDDADEEGRGGEFPRERDLVALFGEVLPRHPFLAEICLSHCDVDPAHLQRFFRSLPSVAAGRLEKLHLRAIPLSTECCAALGDALGRNVPVESVAITQCRLDSARCQVVCEGAARNEHLRMLAVGDREALVVQGDTFRDILESTRCTRLTSLALHAHAWDPLGYRAFVKGLRANRIVELLILGRFDGGTFDRPMIEDMEDLLRWHNCTISDVHFTPEPDEEEMTSVRALLVRNDTIQTAVLPALVSNGCRVMPPALWPRAMDRVGTMPAILYPFLRVGNVDELATRVVAAAAASSSSCSSPLEAVPPADSPAAA